MHQQHVWTTLQKKSESNLKSPSELQTIEKDRNKSRNEMDNLLEEA